MKQNWHALSPEKTIQTIESSPEGLSAKEAEDRLRRHGPNELPQEKGRSILRLLFNQFNSPLMYIMGSTIVISFFLGHVSDAIFIIIVVVSNGLVGFYQENKANRSVASLRNLVKIKCRVYRDGSEHELESSLLVPGDVLVLQAGDQVPADARLLECHGLKVSEANLTGESLSVEKQILEVKADAELGDRKDMVFMGTFIEDGWAKAMVVETGVNTQMGEIVSLLEHTEEKLTPLQQKIAKLSKRIGVFILGFIGLIILEGHLRGRTFAEILAAALALAVAAIPEGLLPAITIILVLGMRRILKQKGLVRKLVANETLGGVTVICTDKTGTLTEGKMAVSRLLAAGRELHGDSLKAYRANDSEQPQSFALMFTSTSLCGDAFLENPDDPQDQWVVRGRLTEQALLKAAYRAGLIKPELEKKFPIQDKLFFSSELKYSAALCQEKGTKQKLFVTGAPERVVAHVKTVHTENGKAPISDPAGAELLQEMEAMAKSGLRVVSYAYRDFETPPDYQEVGDLVEDLTLLGFIALEDPLRQDVPKALEDTRKAGIRTVVITGDHKFTAVAIATKLGFNVLSEHVLEGHELDKLSEQDLKEKCRTVTIYARVSPRHKLQIVSALQSNGEVVAMLGDGVNDAPALKAANIGVAVGTQTDVVREVADLVLLDGGFSTIVKAIEQGRIIFTNIRKVFMYLVTQDFSELFLFLIAIALGMPLPLLPAQILWINLVESGLPDIALTTEQEKDRVMEEPPRHPNEPILSKQLRSWMISIFLASGIVAFVAYLLFWQMTGDWNKTRTMVFILMSMESLLLAFSVRSFRRSIWRKDIFSNRLLVGAVIISFLLIIFALYSPMMQKVMSTQPIGFTDWLVILFMNVIEISLIELSKKMVFQKRA